MSTMTSCVPFDIDNPQAVLRMKRTVCCWVESLEHALQTRPVTVRDVVIWDLLVWLLEVYKDVECAEQMAAHSPRLSGLWLRQLYDEAHTIGDALANAMQEPVWPETVAGLGEPLEPNDPRHWMWVKPELRRGLPDGVAAPMAAVGVAAPTCAAV
jgi:hypothetical protein